MNKNKLPKDWKIKTLGDILKISSGNGLAKSKRNDEGEFLVYGGNGITGKHNEYLFEEDKLIIGRVGAHCGNAYITKPKSWVTDNAFVVSFNDTEVNKKFLLNLIEVLNLNKYSVSTAQPVISQRTIYPIEITLPPLETQQAIVSKIEEIFSELDKGIEDLKTAQQQLKTYRQSVLKYAFEGKLTKKWRTGNKILKSTDELLDDIKKEKIQKIKKLSPITAEEFEDLFKIPKEWKWVKNEDYLFEVKDGTHDSPKYLNEGIPFITQKNIKESGLNLSNFQYISNEDHNKFYQRSNVSKGDILISMIGHNRGMSAIVENDKIFSIKNVGLFKFNSKLQYNKFSYYYYQSQVGLNIVLKKSKGGAQPFIGLTELRNWPVVVCSIEEQHQIVLEIESRLSVADKMEESISQSLQQAEALRQSILKKAFSGELV